MTVYKDFEMSEKEAREELNYWLDLANSRGWGEQGRFDKKIIDNTLDILECMLSIYNKFARIELELIEKGDTRIYELAPLD